MYGVREGSNGKRKLEPNNSALTQNDIDEKIGISVDTLQNYKMLATLATNRKIYIMHKHNIALLLIYWKPLYYSYYSR